MKKVLVKEILGHSINARQRVQELRDYINERGIVNPVIDFSGVDFVTRSFMDEIYNVFIKENSASVINLSDDLAALLDVVKTTQHKEKPNYKGQKYYKAETLADLEKALASSPF